jgi:AraC-like DNA-binding protein
MPPRGTIVLIRLSRSETPERLDALLTAIGRRLPTCAIVLQVDRLSPQQAAQTALRSRRRGVRAILTESTIDPAALRDQLSDPAGFPDDFVHWLDVRLGHELTPLTRELVHTMARCPLDVRTLASIEKEMPAAADTIAEALKSQSLPTPGALFHAIRLVRISISLQADPARSLTQAAHELGFYDLAHMSRQCAETIGVSPGDTRKHLGWEWIAYFALRRARKARP